MKKKDDKREKTTKNRLKLINGKISEDFYVVNIPSLVWYKTSF